ncbi:MAG: glycosyltransferase [Xanthomonadaceae bacterium]|nr:glycosyltransferase [Xanthomonadaceae bacterium]
MSLIGNENYKFIESLGAWARPDYPGIAYSDGDENENHLAGIIRDADDVSLFSPELRRRCTDWPTLYHLSPQRANLLRPFEAMLKGNVLEIGAGCGAITRYLGESGGNILALEGSPRRASIAASRTRDLGNVAVLAERFDNFGTDRRFDAITLIGVLEYANLYSGGDSPVLTMLNRVRQLLKPEGLLFVAIENQLGLKYFAGSQEDHVGIPMYGLEDRYSNAGVTTYGRVELHDRLKSAGLEMQDWWFPFPDYKLPSVMMSEKAISKELGERFSAIVEPTLEADPQAPRSPYFMAGRVWGPVVRNDLGPDLANSFLVIAGAPGVGKPHDVLADAYHFAVQRKPEYAKSMAFSESDNGHLDVQGSLLYPQTTPSGNAPIRIDMREDAPFVDGILWTQQLKSILSTESWQLQDIGQWAQRWYDALLEAAALDRGTLTAAQPVPGQFLDAVPRNLIVKDTGETVFIDREWSSEAPIELGFLVFRGVYLSLLSIGEVLSPAAGTSTNGLALLTEIARHLGLDIPAEDFLRYIESENRIQKWVSDGPGLQVEHALAYALRVRHAAVLDQLQEIAAMNAALNEQLSSVTQALERQTHDLMKMSAWVDRISNSPGRFVLKRGLYLFTQKVFRMLPLGMESKQKLKRQALSVLRAMRPKPVGTAQAAAPALREGGSGPVFGGRDIFVFSIIDWHFRIQRPQHLARSYAKLGKRVFFFSNHFVDSNEPGYEIEALDPALALYQVKLKLKGAPAIYSVPPTPEQERMLEASISMLMVDIDAKSLIAITQHSFWFRMAKRLPNAYRIYDCMDHHEGFGNVSEAMTKTEKQMLRESDLVVVTSYWLEDYARRYNSSIAVVRNAGEYGFFSKPPAQTYVDSSGRKIIGYYGAIAEWFDLDLVRQVAKANPDCLVLLVGSDTINAAKALSNLKNVVFTGEVPYSKLPYYLYAFDVCLLPFRVNPLTLATNPVKVYEYLASGKPVVCVDLPEIAQFGNRVYKAIDAEDFVRLVSNVLATGSKPREIQARKEFAATQTWDSRVLELDRRIRQLPFPRISVVVLTYNNLDLTRACLDSLITRSDYPDLEIVIVDNASSDGSPEYLEKFAAKYPNVKLILNDHNAGFAAGNNIGLDVATGDYLVVLNNDTVVTNGWAMTMLRHIQDDSQIGLIGPITNNIGNEAKVDMTYRSLEDMPAEAQRITLRNMGKTYPMRTVAFFCAMLPKTVYEECGPICEDYGRGFFEDDDYCRRVETLGKKIVCADDVFVHHHLSASFSKLKDEERQALFRRNREVYESKWGPWVPHTYREP